MRRRFMLAAVSRGIHAAHMRAERNRISVRVHLLVVEIVVALRIGAKRRVVFIGRQHERRATAPAAHELRGYEFLFFRCLAVLAQELAESAHMLLHAAISHVAAVAGQNFGLRHRIGSAAFVGIAEDEFARLERRPGAGRRFLTRAFDDRL